MKHLKKIFENESSNHSEDYEECIDIIETLKENYEDQVKISEINKVYLNSIDSSISVFENGKMTNESQKRVISFFVSSIEEFKTSNAEDLDKVIGVINIAKQILKKVSIYCDQTYFNIHKNSVNIRLMFNEEDQNKLKEAKYHRVWKRITDAFKDYRYSKVIDGNDNFKFLNSMGITDPKTDHIYSIKYKTQINDNLKSEDKIVITISEFKYSSQSQNYGSFKSFKPTPEQMYSILNAIASTKIYFYEGRTSYTVNPKSDDPNIKVEIDKNKIIYIIK